MPTEMMELVVLKAILLLHHKVYRSRLVPRGDLLALTTIMSVCEEWWKIITDWSRKYHRRVTKYHFNKKVNNNVRYHSYRSS